MNISNISFNQANQANQSEQSDISNYSTDLSINHFERSKEDIPQIVQPFESNNINHSLPLIIDIINRPLFDDTKSDTDRFNKKKHKINKLKKPIMTDLIIESDKNNLKNESIIDKIIESTSEKLAYMIYKQSNQPNQLR